MHHFLRSKCGFLLCFLLILPFAGLFVGCGGGGGVSGPANAFTGNYKGVYYTTAGPAQDDAKFFDFAVLSDGSIRAGQGGSTLSQAKVQSDGSVNFSVTDRNGVSTTVKGQFRQPGTATLVTTSSNGNVSVFAVAQLTGRDTTFDGNYFGTARVRTGTGIGTVEAVTVTVAANGDAVVILTGANGATRSARGTADLNTGTLVATGRANNNDFTVTLNLSKTGQAGGIFESPINRGTVALNKV